MFKLANIQINKVEDDVSFDRNYNILYSSE